MFYEEFAGVCMECGETIKEHESGYNKKRVYCDDCIESSIPTEKE